VIRTQKNITTNTHKTLLTTANKTTN